jgi:hypothetical protein
MPTSLSTVLLLALAAGAPDTSMAAVKQELRAKDQALLTAIAAGDRVL